LGLTVPFKVAELDVTFVAELVVTVGAKPQVLPVPLTGRLAPLAPVKFTFGLKNEADDGVNLTVTVWL
jgi:hypothetical protein